MAALGVATLLRKVEMQHIMVRVAAVADIMNQGRAVAAAAIKA